MTSGEWLSSVLIEHNGRVYLPRIMKSKLEPNTRRSWSNNRRDTEIKTKLFYLFFIAQLCAIFGMVVGVIFFILRLIGFIK